MENGDEEKETKVMLEKHMCKCCISCHYLLLPAIATSGCGTTPYTGEVFQTMLFVCLFNISIVEHKFPVGLQLISSPIQIVIPALMLVVMVLLAALE